MGGSEIQKVLLRGFDFIKKNDNLLAAKKIMKKEPTIQDVFITEDGSPKGAVVGWITNRIIMEKANL